MNNLIIIFQCILIFNCRITNATSTTNSNIDTRNIDVDTINPKIEASRYYYSKHFDAMVSHSLQKGFNIRDQFGSEDSYVIIKAAYTLSMNGDTTVKFKLFQFIKSLAESERDYVVDESIFVLVDFSIKLYGKELFIVGIEFLNPKHLNLNVEPNSDEGSGDYTSVVFTSLASLMIQSDREFYNGKFSALFSNVLAYNQTNASMEVWNEFYPYLLNELNSNKIEFNIN